MAWLRYTHWKCSTNHAALLNLLCFAFQSLINFKLQFIELEDGAEEPCLPGNHQVVVRDHYTVYRLSEQKVINLLPTNKWLLFKDRDGECTSIIAVNTTDTSCILVSVYDLIG